MHIPRSIACRLPALLMAISLALPASARAKTDVVILKNGDHITCEIKYLARGMLTVSTDSMSTVQIKWQDVKSITSQYLFTIQDTKGQIYVGSLLASTEERRVNITGPVPADFLALPSIVQIQGLEGSLWKRFSGSADLAYSFTKGSDLKQLNFSGDITYRTERYSAELNYSSTFGTSKGETDADRKLASLVGAWNFSRKWIGYSQLRFEHNLELQLDRRFSVLAGPGYRITQSNRSLITAIAAASFTRESYYGEGATKNAEGFFGIDAEFFKLYSPKVDIVNQFVFIPNFTTLGRNRLELNSKLKLEVLKDFFVTLTFYDSYDSRPPAATAATNDYGFTTGISWTFRR